MGEQSFDNDSSNNYDKQEGDYYSNLYDAGQETSRSGDSQPVTDNNYYQDYTDQYQYGSTDYNAQNWEQQSRQNSGENALSIIGLVFGILSIVTSCCFGIGIVPGIVGLVCSIFGEKRQKSGLAIGGLICSIIGVLLSILMLGLVVLSMIF